MRVYQDYFTKGGKRVKTRKWYIDFTDHLGRRHRMPGFTEKRATEAMANRLEDLVSLRSAGQQPTPALQIWIEQLPERIVQKFISWGLLDSQRGKGTKPLSVHLADWHRALLARGCTSEYADLKRNRVKKIFDTCKFRTFSDISASRLQEAISQIHKTIKRKNSQGIIEIVEIERASKTTQNYYLAACKQFFKWAVQDRRISENPLAHLRAIKANSQKRKAFESAELRWLIQTTKRLESRYGMDGPARSLLYRLTAESGFRAGEIRALKVGDFDLDNRVVTLSGEHTKNGEAARLPLRPATIALLRDHFKGKTPQVPAFDLPSKYSMARMLRKDMSDARKAWIEYAKATPKEYKRRQESDFLRPETKDFHCLRHSLASLLAAGGVHPKTAQELMRHSSITLTMDRYSHTYRGQTDQAIAALPDFDIPVGQKKMTVDAVGEDRLASSASHSAIFVAELCKTSQNTAKARLQVGDTGTPRNTPETAILAGKTRQNELRVLGLEPKTYGLKGRCSTN